MSDKPYSAIAIANAFIERAREDGEGISPMKIQKLIYFAHAWMLALTKKSLIRDRIKAWKFGPVINSVYQEFKVFGSQDITDFGIEVVFRQGEPSLSIPTITPDDEDALALVDRIWQEYGHMSAIELSNLTHEPGSPWHETINEHKEGAVQNYLLSNELIGQCMAKQLEVQE